MEMNGAELIIHLLARQGIRIIAGIPGGANLPLYDALSHYGKIRHILARHEQGAGFIAQGMARTTGLPQVCFATSGPGVTNLATAIADAKLDSVPVICITGQVPNAMIGTDAFQEVDTFGLSIPITKHNYLVRSANELLRIIPEAFRIAISNRPGPVLIDVPKDVQLQTVEFQQWPEPGRPDPPPVFDPGNVVRAAEIITAAKKPILYVGGGVLRSEASGPAVALAEKATIPMAMTLMGLGVIHADHPLSLGMLGMHAARHTNLALEMCDVLIAAGVRFDDRATGQLEAFCPKAKVVHIDIDPCEMHKLRRANVGIIGDAAEVLTALIPMVPKNDRIDWHAKIDNLKKRFSLASISEQNPLSATGLIKCAARHLSAEAIIVTDVGQHQMWTAQAYPFQRPRQFLTSGGLGTMGFGVPAAIGAALANPDLTVVCFTGDGSVMMNIQEMATAVEENVNLKIVLINNNALGLVRQQQDLFYRGQIYASEFRCRVDFIKIANGFGMRTVDLSTICDDAGKVMAREFNRKGPCLIHAPIDKNEMVLPMVPPGAANMGMIDKPPHDFDHTQVRSLEPSMTVPAINEGVHSV